LDRLLYISSWALSLPGLLSGLGSCLFLLKLHVTRTVFISHTDIGFYVSVWLIYAIALLGVAAWFSTPVAAFCCVSLIVRNKISSPRRKMAILLFVLSGAGLLLAYYAVPRIIPAP